LLRRILYITNSTDENNTVGYRHSNIIKVLSDFSKIDVIDFDFTEQKITFFRKVINKLFIFPDIYQLSANKYKRVIRKKICSNQYELVIICVIPFSFLCLATFVKKLNANLRIVVDMTDPLSINVSYLNYWFPYKTFIKWYEKRHLKNVNRLIVLNNEIKTYYEKKYSFLENVVIIEQGIQPIINQSINNKNTIKSNFSFVYAGMFYNHLREPFELYKAVLSSKESFQLFIYGSFKKKFVPPNDKKIYFGGLVNKKELVSIISTSTAIIFLDNFYGPQIPGKILENLATGKPILFIYMNEDSPTLRYVREYEGIYYSKNDSEEICRNILDILKDGQNYYKRDLTKYYWNNLIKESTYF
jgi:hypothetical protein